LAGGERINNQCQALPLKVIMHIEKAFYIL